MGGRERRRMGERTRRKIKKRERMQMKKKTFKEERKSRSRDITQTACSMSDERKVKEKTG